VNLITRDELRKKLERHDEFKLVMTLQAAAFESKHIPGSLHFESPEEAVAALDRGDEIVVYCADVSCPASIRAYRFLERAGFTRVRRYAGGIAEWEEAGYPLVAGRGGRTRRRRSQSGRQVIACSA
jgi:rhodanese-related sulfurtransferase